MFDLNDDIIKKVTDDLNLTDEVEEEEVVEEDSVEEEIDQEHSDHESDHNEDEEEETEVILDEPSGDDEIIFKREKKTKEEKKNYAFAELRKTNKEQKDKLEKLNELANLYGFINHEEMISKLEEDAIRKQAATKGIDPELYKKMHNTEKELERLKFEREQEKSATRVEQVLSKIDSFVNEFGLNEQSKTDLIERLDEDGFTLEDLARLKNHNNIFKGYMSAEISARNRQKQIERENKKKKLEEKQYTGDPINTDVSVDDIIREMMKKQGSKY